MKYNLYTNWDQMNKRTNEEVLSLLQKLFPKHQLYNISLGWREDRKYILKAKGLLGDVIVGWC